MDAAKQREEFLKLTGKAHKAGLLKWCSEEAGIAVIEIPAAVDPAPSVASVPSVPLPAAASTL